MGENQRQRLGNPASIHHQDHQGTEHVGNSHDRHQFFGDLADAADAADDDNAGQHRQHDAGADRRHVPGLAQSHRHRIGLDHAADTEGGEAAEQGKQPAKPFQPQPFGNVAHRSALHGAVGQVLAIFHRQHGLGIFGRHPDQGADPHPEDRSRAAEVDGRGHPGDVAGADGGRQGGGQRLERGDIPLGLAVRAFRKDELERLGQLNELQKTEAQGQISAGPHQQRQHVGPPDKAVQAGHKFGQIHMDLLVWRDKKFKAELCRLPAQRSNKRAGAGRPFPDPRGVCSRQTPGYPIRPRRAEPVRRFRRIRGRRRCPHRWV